MNARLPKGLFLLMAAGAGAHFQHYYALLPSVVASHFDARGIPNGWSSKQTFFEIFAWMTVLGAVLVFGMPKIITVMPIQLINLPNKRYWLAPGQRAASLEFLSGWFAWFGCAVYAVIVVAFDYAVQSNLHAGDQLDATWIWYTIGLFGAFTVVWTIRLYRRFGRAPRGASS